MKILKNKKIKKLIKDPNLFFYDMFSKKIHSRRTHEHKKNNSYLNNALDIEINPWVHISKEFDLKTGVITGYPDQSLLIENHQLENFILYVFRLATIYKMNLNIYTLGGSLNFKSSYEKLYEHSLASSLIKELSSKPDFVVDFSGTLTNNFSGHIFIYDIQAYGIASVRSRKARIKKFTYADIDHVYPEVINEFGEYRFSTPYPIDIVYTWVNKDDPEWQELWDKTFPDKNLDYDRYSSKDELKYSLRSIEKFAPWFNKIFIVSNCKRPDWLKENKNITWVEHNQIIKEDNLPTFSSHAIESSLHNIEELSEKFIYFNDDMFLNQPCYYLDFFDELGRSISYFEPYGMVTAYNPNINNVDYLIASKNSQKILSEINPLYPALNLHKHVPYALSKRTLFEIEKKENLIISNTRKNKLRSITDVNLTSFLYHHYAQINGKGITSDCSDLIVRPENISKLLNRRNIVKYKFLCFNDGNGSSMDKEYINKYYEFCNTRFPAPSSFEVYENDRRSIKLSKVVMAYKDRKNRIPYLRKMLGNLDVSLDDGSLGLWGNSKKCWLSYDKSADYHLVIQDDAVICKDFYERLESIIKKHNEEYVYCLYFRLKSRKTHSEMNEAASSALKEKGFHFNRLQFAVALVIPTKIINDMIDYADNLDPIKYKNTDDLRFSKYLNSINKKVFYPLPSLVDHSTEGESLAGNGHNLGRQATWFIDRIGNNQEYVKPTRTVNVSNQAKKTDKKSINIDNKNLDTVPVFWWDGTPNFGDEIGPFIVQKITKKTPINIRANVEKTGLACVGSIIQQINRPNMDIWGSGIIRALGKETAKKLSIHKPKVHAVRGKKSHEYLTKILGWDVPEVFGDPALLLPRYYNPIINIKALGKIVLCPHYIHTSILNELFTPDIYITNVRNGLHRVVDDISSASICISTSLHGLIVAQAYEIPWVWLHITDLDLKGEDFKFEDFFSILDEKNIAKHSITSDKVDKINFLEISKLAKLPKCYFNESALLDAFPKKYL